MEVSKSSMVRNFFCFDDPPGPEDSLEESRMLCENLEDAVIGLQEVVRQRDREVDVLKAEVSMLRAQQQALLRSLKLQTRLSSVAYAQLQDEQRSKMDNAQSKQFLAQMHKVNNFNMALAKSIDRTFKSSSLDHSSRLSLTRVEEENAISCSVDASNTSIMEKVVSMDDICSRSTGDGSTGSHERLPPVGGASEGSLQQELPRTMADVTVNGSNLVCRSTKYNMDSRTISPIGEDLNPMKHSENSRVAIIHHENISNTPCMNGTTPAQLQLDTISFKKLLENNPEITESRLSQKMLLQPVVPLSSIPIMST